MKFTTTFHGGLGSEGSPVRMAIEALMPRLALEDVRLPGTLDVRWKRSDLKNHPDELVATLYWSESAIVPSVRITPDELLDPNQFDSLQRSFNRALSKFYLARSEKLLLELDALSDHPPETAVAP